MENLEGNKSLDYGSFSLYDNNPIIVSPEESVLDAISQQLATNVQFIFQCYLNSRKEKLAMLESLPEEKQLHDFELSRLYLPIQDTSITFPRSRQVPQEKPDTKWERFAKEKGIQKRKKTGMSYDPDLKRQVARWGIKSAKNAEPPILEEKVQGRNPFEDRRNEKILKRSRQHLKEIKNVSRREGKPKSRE